MPYGFALDLFVPTNVSFWPNGCCPWPHSRDGGNLPILEVHRCCHDLVRKICLKKERRRDCSEPEKRADSQYQENRIHGHPLHGLGCERPDGVAQCLLSPRELLYR